MLERCDDDLAFAFSSPIDLRCPAAGSSMEIRTWEDRRTPAVPRVTIQQGTCELGQCGQFSISISNGQRGMTVRFESEAEFREFLERGQVEKL